jgi:hypothetical protein
VSGSSMNYMYRAAHDEPEILVANREYLEECVEIVQKAEAEKDAPKLDPAAVEVFIEDTRKVREWIDRISQYAVKYESVLQACEWFASGDWWLDEVKKALMKVASEAQSTSAESSSGT